MQKSGAKFEIQEDNTIKVSWAFYGPADNDEKNLKGLKRLNTSREAHTHNKSIRKFRPGHCNIS